MKKQSYWIKERHNPQFDKPYFMAYGQLSKRAAKKKEESLYGWNVMIEYKTEAEYIAAIENFKASGFRVAYS